MIMIIQYLVQTQSLTITFLQEFALLDNYSSGRAVLAEIGAARAHEEFEEGRRHHRGQQRRVEEWSKLASWTELLLLERKRENMSACAGGAGEG